MLDFIFRARNGNGIRAWKFLKKAEEARVSFKSNRNRFFHFVSFFGSRIKFGFWHARSRVSTWLAAVRVLFDGLVMLFRFCSAERKGRKVFAY